MVKIDSKAKHLWLDKSKDEEIKKYLSAVDEGYMKDLKETHEKPNDKFDSELADDAEKTRRIRFYGLLASLTRGRALHLVKAVEDSNGFDAWRPCALGSSHCVASVFNE